MPLEKRRLESSCSGNIETKMDTLRRRGRRTPFGGGDGGHPSAEGTEDTLQRRGRKPKRLVKILQQLDIFFYASQKNVTL